MRSSPLSQTSARDDEQELRSAGSLSTNRAVMTRTGLPEQLAPMSSRRERAVSGTAGGAEAGCGAGIVDAARGLRVSFLVALGDEAAGAGRFWERLGPAAHCQARAGEELAGRRLSRRGGGAIGERSSRWRTARRSRRGR